MGLSAQPFELLLDLGALAADAFQPALIVLHLLLVARPLGDQKRRQADDVEQQRQAQASSKSIRTCLTILLDDRARRPCSTSHTLFKCRPTLIALPNSPMSAPNATIAAACSRVKNADGSRYRLMRRYAATEAGNGLRSSSCITSRSSTSSARARASASSSET